MIYNRKEWISIPTAIILKIYFKFYLGTSILLNFVNENVFYWNN